MKSTDDFRDLPISSRDVASLILIGAWKRGEGDGVGDDIDDESQLRAICGVLVRNRAAEIGVDAEIETLHALAKKTRSERAMDDLHYLCDVSTYQDAAHSMVAASLLAPFIEGILSRAVRGVENLKGTHAPVHRNRMTWREIKQRIVVCGIRTYMPPDFDEVVDALFLYRNKVLHCGLEWPREDLNEFSSRLRKWPADWFSKVTLNDVPAIFMMTPVFVRRCFILADQITGCLIDFEEHNKELFADVIGTPPEWLHADISATHEVTHVDGADP